MEEDAAREAEGTPARNSPDPPSSPSAVVLEAEPYALMLSTGWREPMGKPVPGQDPLLRRVVPIFVVAVESSGLLS